MSEIKTTAATREELAKAAEAAREAWIAKGTAACKRIEQLFKHYVFVGMGEWNDRMKIKVENCGRFELCVVDEDGRDDIYTIDLCYDAPYGGNARKLRMNGGSYGTFDRSSKALVLLYTLAGKVASNLETLEYVIADEIDWDGYSKAKTAYYDASYALREFDAAKEREARDAARAEVVRQIVPGAVITYKEKFMPDLHITKVARRTVYVCATGRCDSRLVFDDVVASVLAGKCKIVSPTAA